ncbi:MAG TPA: hypothetical protein VMM17_02035 [Gemmatimonadaceae bacterium]|nr:hypothetical protein [Gemmatimonadaceae bacterium]
MQAPSPPPVTDGHEVHLIMPMRQVVLVPAVAALSFGIWLASVATLRHLLLPTEPTLAASVTTTANPNVAVAWLLMAVLMTAMLRLGDVRSLKRAAAIATPMAPVGMAVALGYHLSGAASHTLSLRQSS